MLDIFKILDANIEIPLGTGFETQTVSSGETPTSVKISFSDNVKTSETFDKQYSYLSQYEIIDNVKTTEQFDITFSNANQVNIEDNILIVDTFNKEYIYVVNKEINDKIITSEEFSIKSNNYSEYSINDNVNVTETYTSSYAYNVSKTFEDGISVTESFELTPIMIKEYADNIKTTEDFNWYAKTFEQLQERISITEQFFMQEVGPVGELVFTNTVKNKYIDEPFIDNNVVEGKIYNYIVRTYNDFNIYSSTNEMQVTVQNAGDITPPANAIVSVSYDGEFISVNVTDPDDSDWQSTTLRYNTNNNVSDKSSGIKLFENTIKNRYKDSPYKIAAIVGKTYYFKAFTKDLYGNVNETMQSVTITTYVPGGVIPTAPISDLKIVLNSNNNTANVTWTDPADENWKSTFVIVKEGSMPKNETDGVLYLSNQKNKYKTTPLVVSVPKEDTLYYVKAFPKNDYIFNYDSASVSIRTLDLTPPANVEEFKITYSDYRLKISVKNSNTDIKGIKIVRFNGVVGNITEGIEIADVVDLNGEYSLFDETINYNTTYSYKCYPYDKFNNINYNDASYSVYTKDERISDISDLNVEIIGEDVVFTYTNPSNDYFLESNLYVDYKKIYDNGEYRKSLNTSSVKGYIKLSVKITELKKYIPDYGQFYFLVVAKNYEGKEIYNTQYNVNKVIKDTVPPVDIQNLNVYIEDGYANLTWDESVSSDWLKSLVVVKEGSAPETQVNGTLVKAVTIKNEHQVLPLKYKLTKQNVMYYFKVFPVDDNFNVNETCIPVTCTLDVPAFNESVTDLKLENVDGNIVITCKDPQDTKWNATKLVRNSLHIPTDPDDGEVVFVNYTRDKYITNGYIDRNLQPRKTYYYAAFCKDIDDIYSNSVAKASIFLQNIAPPSAVEDLSINIEEDHIDISWSDVNDIEWEGCKLVKKVGSAPTSFSDGQLLIDNNIKNRFQNAGFIDNQFVEGSVYYYSVFTYNTYGIYSQSNIVEYKSNDVTPTGPAQLININQEPHPTDIVLNIKVQDPDDADWAKTVIRYDVYGGDFSNARDLFTITTKNKYYDKQLSVVCNDLLPNTKYQFKAYPYDLSGNVNNYGNVLSMTIFENVNIGQSIITDIKYEDYKIKFNIDDDELKDFTGCKVIRKTTYEPTSHTDADKVIADYNTPDSFKTTQLIDNDIKDFTTYYYKPYPYKTLSNGTTVYNSSCEAAMVTTQVTTVPAEAPITATLQKGAIYLSWNLIEDGILAECYVVKKVGSMPTSENDGELLVHSIGGYRISSYIDTNVSNNNTYYYRTFTVDKYGNWNRNNTGTSIAVKYLDPTGPVSLLKIYQAWNMDDYGYVDGSTTALTCTAIGNKGDNFQKLVLLAKRDGVPSVKDGLIIKTKTDKNTIDERIDVNNQSGVSFYDNYRNVDWYFKAVTYDQLNTTYESQPVKFTAYMDKSTAYGDKYAKALYDYFIGATSMNIIQESFKDTDAKYKPNTVQFKYYAQNKNSSNVLPTFRFRLGYYSYLDILTGKSNINGDFGKAHVDNKVQYEEVRKTFDPAIELSKECIVTLPETPTTPVNPTPIDHWSYARSQLNIATVSAAFNDSQYDPSEFEFELGTYPFVRKTYYYPNMFKVDTDASTPYVYMVLINAEMASYGQGNMNYNTIVTFKRGSMPTSETDGTKLYHAGYNYGGTDKSYYDEEATNRLKAFIQNGKSTSFLNPCSVFKIPKADFSSTNKLYFKAFFVKDNYPNKGTYTNTDGEVTLY